MKELRNKETKRLQFTLGNIIECEDEYIVYDGSDYIGFKKTEYELINMEDNKYGF